MTPATLHADHPLRRASWLWPAGLHDPLYNSYADFVRSFDLAGVPASAPLHVTADAQYVLYLNGSRVGRGPARGFQSAWPYDTYDVAPLLRPGNNVLAARAHTPGRGTFGYRHDGAAGFLLALDLGDRVIATDADWLVRLDPSHARLTPALSAQLSHQEHVDLRHAPPWQLQAPPALADDSPERVAVADAIGGEAATYQWHRPPPVRPLGTPPWHGLSERGVPHLTDHVRPYAKLVATAEGPAAGESPDGLPDPSRDYLRDAPGLSWQDADGDAAIVDFPETPAGRVRVAVVDLGGTRVGEPRLQVSAGEGVTLDLLYTQAADAKGRPVVPPPDFACRVDLASRLTLADGPAEWEAFQLIGHRHLALVVRGPAPALTVKPTLRETVYPLEVAGAFDCDDSTTNDIWTLCRETQRVCLLDAYVDTPWREQAQWWGDARVQSQNTFHLAPDARPLRRGLRQIASQSLPSGLLYGHSPTIAHNCVLPDFNLVWLITLFDDYWQTGQTDMLEELWPTVERVVNYFRTEGCGENGLLAFDPRYWLFLDWSDLHKTGTPTLLNLWHVWALGALAQVCEAAGWRERAQTLAAERLAAARRVDEHLFDADAGLYHDGLDDDGRPVDRHSVQNQTLAILAGLRPGGGSPLGGAVADYLLDRHAGAKASSYWVTYVYDAAEVLGHERLMLDHLRARWAPMLPWGGCFETFDAPEEPGVYSVSHAWAAHPLYHLMRTLGGVRQAAPGWAQVLFRPILNWTHARRAAADYPTPRGMIRSRWHVRGNEAQVTLEVPEGVEAEIDLPGVAETVGGGQHQWAVGVAA